MTDPSYKGQIVTLTYPHIGNYGISNEDEESSSPKLSGLIVREITEKPSNYRSEESIITYLKRHKIVALSEIETRELVLHIREKGAMKAVISATDTNHDSLVKKAKKSKGLVGRDLVKEVTTKSPYNLKPLKELYNVVALDFGIKKNIIRSLNNAGCSVKILPASTPADEILKENPDGVFLSNGPGDPEAVSYAIPTIKSLIGKKPLFGICLGHQLLGIALGGKTFKLKYGHRGANHPVKNLSNGKVEISSQNHGFCLDENSLDQSKVEITHLNLNDNTVEGLRHKKHPVFSVQYHPEASPGPHDSLYLFEHFTTLMKKEKVACQSETI